MSNFQRKNAISNSHVGNDFELIAKEVIEEKLSIELERNYAIEIGFNAKNKGKRKFDLSTSNNLNRIVIECKSHTWTKGDNVPSAKLTVWNEAMLYFSLLPKDYQKIFFVLKDYSKKRDKTLCQYYIGKYSHLIPIGVEIWEYDLKENEITIFSELKNIK